MYILGITLPKKTAKEKESKSFAFRIKLGEYEVEIQGTREEVTNTLKDLPEIVANIHKAFENLKPKTVASKYRCGDFFTSIDNSFDDYAIKKRK